MFTVSSCPPTVFLLNFSTDCLLRACLDSEGVRNLSGSIQSGSQASPSLIFCGGLQSIMVASMKYLRRFCSIKTMLIVDMPYRSRQIFQKIDKASFFVMYLA
ncbi:hypothetical protein FGO68_gene12643 [Halteria grandinella]|uniref:Uncharacterized protein n=1 Tax=Halteria grandinella TaxID=5974 RepID=A0A8J8T5H3_HALGN|nr:hypothetical protein FGO68_gene12643 [Halteria grandinella]